ncbi:hypothetical protein [Pedobacter punctiformis]|uniref:Uncharacterized protein n=1 Tax=Pedobacter punctiformis TaxID=3004097 RepID=A0ABT4LAK6_9SPHI|nr:hypothetical protein [Pedobacter sp. HCMS5-2]MCZ4244948.1 hypothetical protein [Pedobacter sp. HCMS5-2]
MRATELRIGNLVNTPNPNMNPFKVEAIESEKVGGNNRINSFIYWHKDNIIGIPLDEWWLLKLGFEAPADGESRFDYNYGEIIVDLNDRIYIVENEFYVQDMTIHRLQNIYFALTGEELTIKA